MIAQPCRKTAFCNNLALKKTKDGQCAWKLMGASKRILRPRLGELAVAVCAMGLFPFWKILRQWSRTFDDFFLSYSIGQTRREDQQMFAEART